MNAMENYKCESEKIFGTTIEIPNTDNTNNCIGALNNEDNFQTFKTNFWARLNRLFNLLKTNPNEITNLINTVRAIALAKGYKWSGPYSELVALDYLSQFEGISNITYVERGDVNSFEDSIARQIGQKEIDLDLSFELGPTKIYSDVKSFIPTHNELVDQILDQLEERTPGDEYLIGIDDITGVDYLESKKDYIHELRSGMLLSKLEQSVKLRKTSCEHKLLSGKKATFRIAYRRTGTNIVLSTVRAMCPYSLAADYKYKVLDYYNKLLKNQPSFITLVINPWFNKELNDFADFDSVFCRSLARRVFMELTKNTEDMGLYYQELTGKNLKICDVAQRITGIIFINDKSISNENGDVYSSFIFTNPNATNAAIGQNDFRIYHRAGNVALPSVVDDFRSDNY